MKKNVNFKILVIFTVSLFFVLIYFFINMFEFFEISTVEAVYSENSTSKITKNLNPLNKCKNICKKNKNKEVTWF